MANRARLRIDGLAELEVQLRDLPTTLADEARGIVHAAADNAKREIFEAYPRESGTLRAGLRVDHVDTPYTAVAVLTNTTWYATLFEVGSQERHTKAGLNRGRMPPGRVFFPIERRANRRMRETLLELIARFFTVTR